MIKIETKKKTLFLKDKWNELTCQEFVEVYKILFQFIHKNIDYIDAKLQIFYLLSQLETNWILKSKKKRVQIASNIYLLAEKITFPFENEFTLQSNKMEKFKWDGKKYQSPGWLFDKTFTSNMTAEQFVNCHQMYVAFLITKEKSYLEGLFKHAFCMPYKEQKAERKETPPKTLIFIFFIVWEKLMNKLTKTYPLIFARAEETTKNTSQNTGAGFSSKIFDLAKTMDLKQLKKMYLPEFLELIKHETLQDLHKLKQDLANMREKTPNPFQKIVLTGAEFNKLQEITNIPVKLLKKHL